MENMENMENMQNHKLEPTLLWAQIATDAGRTILEMQATDEAYNWKLQTDRAHPILCSGETPYMACVALSLSYQHPDWELEMWHGRAQLWP